MGSSNYFDWRDGGCTEEVNRLTRENNVLREQVKVAAHQGMDGAKAGYEEAIERQRERIESLETMLENIIDTVDELNIFSTYDFDYELLEDARQVLTADWR